MTRRVRRALLGAAMGLVVAGAVVLGLALWRSRIVAPEATILLRDRQDRFLGEVGAAPEGGMGYWPIDKDDLPPRVIAATLAVEDRRFWFHSGVDLVAVARAAMQNATHARRVSGASTLAMQVVRMQSPGDRTYPRKLLEALSALFMTTFHGHRAVLAQYLRIVPYGNRVHGIAYAARRYLDKPVEDLSWAETAFLTAIPKAPARMNPFEYDGRARAVRRGLRILQLLRGERILSRAEYALARQQIVELRVPPAGQRPLEALHAVLRLQDALDDPEARRALNGRFLVRATLDLDLQAEAARDTREAVHAWEPDGAGNAAALVVDRATNEVRALVGSADYFDAQHAGAMDYTRVPRSPGSALKPFLYALALDRGAITPATVLDDLQRGAGGITDADGLFLGPMLPRAALANSRNVPAAEVLARIGLDEGYGFLRDLGLHDGAESARRYGLGLAIGGLPVTLESLVRAYTVLSAEGRVEDLRLYENQPLHPPHRLLSEDAAREITLFLSDPMARLPSFPRMGSSEFPFPVAIKTGTSSRYRDAWTVAFSTRYLVGIWVGDPDNQPMYRLTGARAAAALAHRILLSLHGDEAGGLSDLSFPPPRGFRPVKLCALTGARATPACDRVLVEWFRPGQEPADPCSAHVRIAVDTRTGRPATTRTPPAFVETRTFVDLPARYASWAAGAGLPRTPSLGHAPPLLQLPGSPLAAAGPATIRLSVTSPENGLRVLRDPETPPEQSTLALRAVVDPPSLQVVWYVDGRPFEVVDYPYTARWDLVPGDHVFQARLAGAGAASASVRITVQ